jgi:hypothetical protein
MSTMTAIAGQTNYLDVLDTYDDLSDIKVGDEVIVKTFEPITNEPRYRQCKVRFATKTQFKVDGSDDRYLKSNGRLVGGGYTKVVYFSEARWAEAERRMRMWQQDEAEQQLRRFFDRHDWQKVDIATLVQIANLLGIEHAVEIEVEANNG